jgi:transcription initiation factor TFIID subunit 6
VYGDGTNSQLGITPECVRVVSEALNGPLLQEEALKELAEQTTLRIRTLLQDAQKYMTHAKRKRMTREDLDLSLRVEGQEPLYGTMAAEHLPFRFASGK